MHVIELVGLLPGVTYLYEVRSTDDLGNRGTDNRGGAYHTFTTPSPPPNPPAEPEWPTYQNNGARQGASTLRFLPPLTRQWSAAAPGSPTFNSSPVVSGGLVYTMEGGGVRAHDYFSGAPVWERPIGVANRRSSASSTPNRPDRSWTPCRSTTWRSEQRRNRLMGQGGSAAAEDPRRSGDPLPHGRQAAGPMERPAIGG